jgi:hypothetical protein
MGRGTIARVVMSLVFPYQKGFAGLTPVVGTTVEILRFAQDDTKNEEVTEVGIWTLTRRFASASPCQGEAITQPRAPEDTSSVILVSL